MINLKYTIYHVKKVWILLLFIIVGLQNQTIQAQEGCNLIDTVCTTATTDLTVVDDGSSTYTWTTENGATLTPSGTSVTVDWSTSTVANGIDSVCVSTSPTCVICRSFYLNSCCGPAPLLIIKRQGAPTLCEFLAENPTDPIGSEDCDGGGQSNLDECDAGQDPEDPSDDETCPLSCQGPCDPTSYYYVAGDNHAISTEQISGPALTDSGFPYAGTMTFGDCLFPQPTPAVMTFSNTGFCLGGITELHWDGASNSFVDVANPCGAGYMVTQADFNAPILTEYTFNSGTPVAVNIPLPDDAGPLSGGDIRNAISTAAFLPSCMTFSGYTNAATGEANCADHVGIYTGYRAPCIGCELPDGSKVDHFTIKIENSVGDYAVYLFKTL